MVLSLTSIETLEVTITKSFVNVLSTLQTSLSEITSSSKKQVIAPILVKNALGKRLTVNLTTSAYKFMEFGKNAEENSRQIVEEKSAEFLELDHDHEIQLVICKDRSKGDTNDVTSYISPLQVNKSTKPIKI